MPFKSLFALPLLGALLCVPMQNTAAAPLPNDLDVRAPSAGLMTTPMTEPPKLPQPEPAQPITHTMTIYKGDKVTQKTFVWENGAWHSSCDFNNYVVCFRDCPRSPWQFYGKYNSPRCAEEAACSLRAHGNLASVRHHCP